jgi:uncharacterized protein YjbJ (UPF0337 family)
MTPAQFWQIEQGNQQNRQEFMQGQQEQLMGAIGQFAGQFADNKALEAKGSAYGDFMKRHGDQLGFDPEWIKGFLSESPRQQAMIGDSIIGMQNTGRSLMNMNYLNAQMGPRTAGPATGTGAGAAAPRESFTF